MNDNQTIIYTMIETAANRGETCPTNSLLAVAIGASSVSSPSAIVSWLEEQGYIKVRRKRASRIVTILATGKQTADASSPWAKSEARAASLRRDRLADLVAEYGSVQKAARIMGISQQRGSQMWRRIVQDLGWQAT